MGKEDLDHLQAEPGADLHKPFIVASICRADLQGILTDEEIARLDDSDMERIADKMSDSYRDAGGYWEALEIMARDVLAREGDQ